MIRLAPNGQLQLMGNVKDKLQVIGILEMAKQAVLHPPPANNGVQIPPPDMQKLLTG